jgi:hypothetical protein
VSRQRATIGSALTATAGDTQFGALSLAAWGP